MKDAYENLANAIVAQAAKDYKRALLRLKAVPDNQNAQEDVAELEAFFRSGWYGLLTSLNGDLLMKQIRAEVIT